MSRPAASYNPRWHKRISNSSRSNNDDIDEAEELRAPAPVQNYHQTERGRQEPYLEDASSYRGPAPPGQDISWFDAQYDSHSRDVSNNRQWNEDIDEAEELRAPAPVQEYDQTERGRRDPYLDDANGYTGPPPGHPTSRFDSPDEKPGEPSPPSAASRLFRELAVIGHLIIFSILGTLARLGTQWLTFYPGAPVTTPVIWANVGGSFVMGFLSEDRRLFQHPLYDPSPLDRSASSADHKARHGKVKKTIPLYIGLATGFCGSFTSFSSFMRDAFLALSNDLPAPYYHPTTSPAPGFTTPYPRQRGWNATALLAVLISEPALSIAALFVGAHTALALARVIPSIPYGLSRHVIDPLAVVGGLAAWAAAIVLAIVPPNERWRSEVLFALAFAPAGALLRFYASLKINPLIASFPLGTFAVNVFGSAVLAMSYDLQRVRKDAAPLGGGMVGCGILQGVEDGFCGCLTTVSTWVAEVSGLRRRHGYIYALASVGTGLALMVAIMGSVRWTVGWSSPVCVTMRTSS